MQRLIKQSGRSHNTFNHQAENVEDAAMVRIMRDIICVRRKQATVALQFWRQPAQPIAVPVEARRRRCQEQGKLLAKG